MDVLNEAVGLADEIANVIKIVKFIKIITKHLIKSRKTLKLWKKLNSLK